MAVAKAIPTSKTPAGKLDKEKPEDESSAKLMYSAKLDLTSFKITFNSSISSSVAAEAKAATAASKAILM